MFIKFENHINSFYYCLILSIISGILLNACANKTIRPSSRLSPLESPLSLAKEIVPTPLPGTCVITGRLITPAPTDLIGLNIFLGDVIEIGNGSHVVLLNRTTAHKGYIDFTTKRFFFVNIPPGLYSLVISEPEMGSWVYTTVKGDIWVIKAEAEQIIDLGDIVFGR